ncbi:uncharacterized protein LOC119662246 [Teleopsis dalmanni]|uniref:uncharacterized protein LOC119662246 n=1 Tax=Teleopsis dalmanni TaxID=139649 RepID=UPI0018CE988D|nr:uncharacterized protein LOC119662246 [Teleopsis dalmanni]XP_037927754.1 uncharacterized protein LOC119662246 [Teleopsis dalmanni]XP_037927755.1 uncharacterized protein LOC119662246 [Teleopsis dalmanni]XP_037927756.1 uncharacterized protein LOC119662246 [Teleopsis dalmanni]XP_037927757.1 uncharacterized protein LOC119662246 [Teleopsis dalmanni]XP_037927758.1 uncharacterized protein LOC119662246 [Teleopsis dalmanni]XP_037927759.1 uncharacterized protein LOC119662246 [Teleopsis dalmanni]XP_0
MQNTSIIMEKVPDSLFQGRQDGQQDGALEIDADLVDYKQPSAFRMKTFMAVLAIVFSVLVCCFLTSMVYVRFGHKQKVLHYRALCAVPKLYDDNQAIPYLLIQTHDLEYSWRSLIAPKMIERLDNNFPYELFLREVIEFNETSGGKVSTAIYVVDNTNSFSSKVIHSFNRNQTAIVDLYKNRCFIMKLNANFTMDANELLSKMQRMEYIYSLPQGGRLLPKQIILPAVADLSFADKQIIRDCHDKYSYILTDYLSEDENPIDELITEDTCFYEFFGRGITEYCLVNIDEISLYENQLETSDIESP